MNDDLIGNNFPDGTPFLNISLCCASRTQGYSKSLMI